MFEDIVKVIWTMILKMSDLGKHSNTQSLYIDSRDKGSTQNVYACTRAYAEVRDHL